MATPPLGIPARGVWLIAVVPGACPGAIPVILKGTAGQVVPLLGASLYGGTNLSKAFSLSAVRASAAIPRSSYATWSLTA
jgi:hypothetical protein